MSLQQVLLSYPANALWGAMVLLSFVGWGELAAGVVGRRWLRRGPGGGGGAGGEGGGLIAVTGPDDPPAADWALKAGWGMALLLAIGGVLLLAGLATRWTLVALVLVGVAAWPWAGLMRRSAAMAAVRGARQGDHQADSSQWPPLSPGTRRNDRRAKITKVVVILLLAGVLAVGYFMSVTLPSTAFIVEDDWIGYQPLVQRIIDTGTLIDPFAIRRLISFGGQSFLMALIDALGSARNDRLLEWGLMPPIIIGHVWSIARPRSSRSYVVVGALAFLVAATPVPSFNTSSSLSGVVMLLTLVRTILPLRGSQDRQRCTIAAAQVSQTAQVPATTQVPATAHVPATESAPAREVSPHADQSAHDDIFARPGREGADAFFAELNVGPAAQANPANAASEVDDHKTTPAAGPSVLLTAMVLAAGVTLRGNYGPAFALVAGLLILSAPSWGRRWPNRSGGLIVMGLAAGVLLLPWSLLLVWSSQTPLYPLIAGTHRFGLDYFSAGDTGLRAKAAAVVRFLLMPQTIALLLPAALAVVASRAGVLLYVAALVGGCVTAAELSGMDGTSFVRYSAPFFAVAAVYTLAWAAREDARPLVRRGIVIAACVGMLGWCALSVRRLTNKSLADRLAVIRPPEGSMMGQKTDGTYASAQSLLPRGAGVLAVVDCPFLLDFARNPVADADYLGFCSPAPGMPLGKGPEALSKYLLGQGIEYIIAIDFDRSVGLYSRPRWRNEYLHRGRPELVMYQSFDDVMNNIDALATPARTVRVGELRVIRLPDTP